MALHIAFALTVEILLPLGGRKLSPRMAGRFAVCHLPGCSRWTQRRRLLLAQLLWLNHARIQNPADAPETMNDEGDGPQVISSPARLRFTESRKFPASSS